MLFDFSFYGLFTLVATAFLGVAAKKLWDYFESLALSKVRIEHVRNSRFRLVNGSNRRLRIQSVVKPAGSLDSVRLDCPVVVLPRHSVDFLFLESGQEQCPGELVLKLKWRRKPFRLPVPTA